MEKAEIFSQIDKLEKELLDCVGISPDLYRKANLKHLDLHYLDFNWKKKNGPTVLLLHGYGGSGVTFFKIIPGYIYSTCLGCESSNAL